jgi:hypothetical protein
MFASHEEHEETLALMKLLALGTHEIEQGHFRSADEAGVPWPVRSALASIAKARGRAITSMPVGRC